MYLRGQRDDVVGDAMVEGVLTHAPIVPLARQLSSWKGMRQWSEEE